MSVTERVGKRPQKNSVKLIDLPKPDTGLATKNNTKNNTVNSIMDIENMTTCDLYYAYFNRYY